MKNYLIALTFALLFQNQASIQAQNPQHNTIQLALLLDVSGSMEGLINQAKTELWTVVNEVAKANKNQMHSRLEIALYEYGRDDNPSKNGYIRKLLDFTSDLDTISQVLFSLRTNGGEEYCGWVMKNALEELQWRDNDSIYRVIFVAGNEPFNQGPEKYISSCEKAATKDIFVNTIHCGDSFTGVSSFWAEGARIGNGQYFFINQNSKQFEIATPFDSLMEKINDSLNTTYWSFGSSGEVYKSNQAAQDENAKSMGSGVKAKRAASKAESFVYNNSKWDAYDAAVSDSNWVKNTSDKDLPDLLKGKSLEEKKQVLDSLGKKRAEFNNSIIFLNRERETYIIRHKPTSSERTLGMSLVEAIHRQAGLRGFRFE